MSNCGFFIQNNPYVKTSRERKPTLGQANYDVALWGGVQVSHDYILSYLNSPHPLHCNYALSWK